MWGRIFGIYVVTLIFEVSCSSCGSPTTIQPIKKMIFDTDGVLDDIVSLIMCLEAERHGDGPKVIAITCLDGVSYLHDCVTNVLKTLKTLNRTDIPVYAGAASPLLGPNSKDLSYGSDGFGNFEFPDPPSMDLLQKKHAVNALIDLVKEYPGEVTVVTVAPLTNIALAVRMYPKFLDEVQQFICMGGSVEGRGNIHPGIDFNSRVDPIANYVVFSSTSKPITLIYLETTVRARTSISFRLALNEFNNPRSWLIKYGEQTALMPEAEYWYCPDAVAIVVATTSGSIVTKSATYYMDAIYEGEKTKGMTVVDYTNITGNLPNTNLIQDIDVAEYKRLMVKYFS